MPQSPHLLSLDIVILGGGFGGVFCGQTLCRLLKNSSSCSQSAIVSEQNYMVFQPMLAEVAGASLPPRHVVNPIRLLCRGLRVIKGRVKSIDLDTKTLDVDTGPFSAGARISFQHLVLALGAEIDLRRVPGMPEHALLMQNAGDAMILRATIISRIEEANVESRPEVRRRLLTFAVVGGGYSGVETAGEILDMLHEIAKYYAGLPSEEIRVVLIHGRDRILPSLSPTLSAYAARKLTQRGLELRLAERVRAVTATKVYLHSGEVIEATTVISTVGNAPNRVIRDLCDRHPVPHEGYRIQTDEFMRVPGYDFLWSCGDCAAVPFAGKAGGACPQTAQFAMRQGVQLAKNLVLTRRGSRPKSFTFTGLGQLASIGHRTAVASIMGMKFSGFFAWFLWRSVYLSKLPGLDRKIRVVIEWTLDLFFPRDINLLNPRYSRVYQEIHLEPGDRLFNRGEPAFSLYVVKEGKIELRDADQVCRIIEPGDFFGERALVHGSGYLYDAVAAVKTELISVSGEVILPFFFASRRLSRLLAKTTAQGTAEAELASLHQRLDPIILASPLLSVLHRDVATLRPDETVGDALRLFHQRRHSAYPLVRADGILEGVIGREDFFDFLKQASVDYSTPLSLAPRMNLPLCRDSQSVTEALEQMVRAGVYKCLVTDKEHHLLGILTMMDLLAAAVPPPPAPLFPPEPDGHAGSYPATSPSTSSSTSAMVCKAHPSNSLPT